MDDYSFRLKTHRNEYRLLVIHHPFNRPHVPENCCLPTISCGKNSFPHSGGIIVSFFIAILGMVRRLMIIKHFTAASHLTLVKACGLRDIGLFKFSLTRIQISQIINRISDCNLYTVCRDWQGNFLCFEQIKIARCLACGTPKSVHSKHHSPPDSPY